MVWTLFALAAAIIWLGILLVPWRPWKTNETLDSRVPYPDSDLSDITAVVPARDEAGLIRRTLASLRDQGRRLAIVLVDDQSTDGTAEIAQDLGIPGLRVVRGDPPPPGWSGKLWAVHQGLLHVKTPLTLLMDADIELVPGILPEARGWMRKEGLQLVSLMAELRMVGLWERLLMPAFIYFFKLVYPFKLSNSKRSSVAAAAGGFILLETRLIREIGGIEVLQGELIDDCALARRIKSHGHRTWLGLTRSVRSLRAYPSLGTIWDMVARTAFTQLRYSMLLLGLCTAALIIAFWVPVIGVVFGHGLSRIASALALGAMVLSYLPTLGFFHISRLWALTLPLIGTLYLGMTWGSALRYFRGERSKWKGRTYLKQKRKRPREEEERIPVVLR